MKAINYQNVDEFITAASAQYDGDFTYVEITDGMNGYPSNLHPAITGFTTFEDAEKFANENDMAVYLLKKKAGHDLWQEHGRAWDQYEISDADYNDDQTVIRWDDAERQDQETWLAEFRQSAEDLELDSFDLIQNHLNVFREAWEAFSDLDKDQAIVLDGYTYLETIDLKPMEWRDRNDVDWCYAVM